MVLVVLVNQIHLMRKLYPRLHLNQLPTEGWRAPLRSVDGPVLVVRVEKKFSCWKAVVYTLVHNFMVIHNGAECIREVVGKEVCLLVVPGAHVEVIVREAHLEETK